jgi:hypothetical protein
MRVNRRQFIASAAAATIAGACTHPPARVRWTGGIVGGSHLAGHRLRTRTFPGGPSRIENVEVVIVGSGIAGLTAAHRLHQNGREFVVLELEATPGGNSAFGQNVISAYPWGAHYVPLPNPESVEVLALLEEFGVINGRDRAGLPIYDETMLCADPMERLFTRGQWQEGLIPQLGLSTEDRRHYADFFGQMDQWRESMGRDGRRPFAIPVDLSSRDSEFTALDSLTMRAFMDARGWTSTPLRWYVDYCCRDDFGAGADQVSAWAGVHYFAGRHGRAANAERDAVLTWPEGNGWLVRRLSAAFRSKIRSQCIAWNLEPRGDQVRVDYFNWATDESVRIEARAAICAVPRFVAQRIVPGLAPATVEYSPWMVANLTLDTLPGGEGAPLAWDNVWDQSESLGYVVATHQHLESIRRATVLTHYWPLDREPPRIARERGLARSYEEWCEIIVHDLERVHPDIATHVRHLDVWLWGHGMVRPVPGFIWGETRAQMAAPLGSIFFAHSDLSGISIFEEACTRGAEAAASVLAHLQA